MSRPKSFDGIKSHYTEQMLDELEKRAHEMSRMDKADKVKLINMSRHALALEAHLAMAVEALERVATTVWDEQNNPRVYCRATLTTIKGER